MKETYQSDLATGINRRYRWLQWNRKRQQGMNTLVIGRPEPQNQAERAAIYAAQRGMLLRLMLPHKSAIVRLIHQLAELRAEMGEMDRQRIAKIQAACVRGQLTPENINTARQIAHKLQVECGFPSFRDADAAQSAARGY